MPPFIETVFGRKKPTVSAARAELAKVEADLAAAPCRIAEAEAKLARVADLTDVEHEAALAELAAAKRSLARFEAQAADLKGALAEALKGEAAESRRIKGEVARKRAAGMKALLDRFDAQAEALAETAREIEATDSEIAAVNYESDAAKRAGLDAPDPIPTSAELFRTEPDTVIPDREVVDQEWFVGGRRLGAMVTVERDGRQVPTVAGAETRKVRRTIPGETRPGRRMESPLMYLTLPATRLGGKVHWPRR